MDGLRRFGLTPGFFLALIVLGVLLDHGHLWWLVAIGIVGLLVCFFIAFKDQR